MLFWNDLRNDVAAARSGGSAPSFSKILDNGAGSVGVFCNLMAPSPPTKDLNFIMQMPHDWAPGTDLSPHVHWAPETDIPIGQTVVWGLEYAWVSQNEGLPAITQTDSFSYSSAALTPALTHKISEWTDIPSGTKGVSSILLARVSREAGTFAGNIWLLGFDFHLRFDTAGGSLHESRKP